MDSLEASIVGPDEELVAAPWGSLGRTATFVLVAGLSKLALRVLNTTTVSNEDRWTSATQHRPAGQGLLTICNHTSTVDDPAVISSIVPLSYFASEHRHHGMRWSLCAREMCHTNWLFSQFFRSGKTLPIDRGKGLSQPVMLTSAALLRRGDWVHVFPEGRVHYSGTLGPLKWGVGKLLCDSVRGRETSPPLILPFYHSGMGLVMPKHAILPGIGHRVHVTVGEPLDLTDTLCKCNDTRFNQKQVWKELTIRIRQALEALQEKSPPNVDQTVGKQ